MKRERIIIINLILFLFFQVYLLNGKGIDFSGYYKSFFIVFKPVDILPQQGSSLQGMVSNHIRLNFLYKISDRLSFKLSYDFIPKIEDKNRVFSGFSSILNYTNQYRAYDLKRIILPHNYENTDGNFAIYQNLDRAFLRLNLDFADIYIGRQAISFGSGKIINPTDIFSPFSFNELDKEERRGVDAIRVRIPTGELSEIDTGYVLGDKLGFSKSGFFLRTKFYIFETDLSLILIGFQNNLLIGADLSRAIGGAGVWFEGAFVKTNFYNKEKENNPSDEYTRISIGADYNFKGVYIFAEYHYNGAGSNTPSDYLSLFTKKAYTVGTVYLMGKHYINIGTNYQITGLITNTNMILYNLSDSSIILSPQIEYNISENIYLSFGAFISIGKSPSYNPYIRAPFLKSEFGTYPDMFFTSFRIYF